MSRYKWSCLRINFIFTSEQRKTAVVLLHTSCRDKAICGSRSASARSDPGSWVKSVSPETTVCAALLAGPEMASSGRRKISLPWFRQSTTPQLTRQHTIDTPGSFQARLLQRQSSQQVCSIYNLTSPPPPFPNNYGGKFVRYTRDVCVELYT